MSDDALDRDLEAAAGNPQLAKAVRAGLERLQQGAGGPTLAEMATELLVGRISLRGLANTAAYGETFEAAVGAYREWREQLTPAEQDELEKRVRDEFGEPSR